MDAPESVPLPPAMATAWRRDSRRARISPRRASVRAALEEPLDGNIHDVGVADVAMRVEPRGPRRFGDDGDVVRAQVGEACPASKPAMPLSVWRTWIPLDGGVGAKTSTPR